MKRIFAILKHLVDYFNLVRLREWIIMLQASTMMLKIDDPSVWDVDRIQQNINAMYEVFHKDPKCSEKEQTAVQASVLDSSSFKV